MTAVDAAAVGDDRLDGASGSGGVCRCAQTRGLRTAIVRPEGLPTMSLRRPFSSAGLGLRTPVSLSKRYRQELLILRPPLLDEPELPELVHEEVTRERRADHFRDVSCEISAASGWDWRGVARQQALGNLRWS